MAEKLDAVLKNYVAEGTSTKDKLLGAAFVVVSKHGIIYQGSAGRTRVDPASPPFTPSSICWGASMTKLFTTLTLLHLVERGGQLTLDEDLRPRVPELASLPILKGFATAADGQNPDKKEGEPLLEPYDAPMTLRHLLTHTAGLGTDVADPDLMRWSAWVGRTANVGSCTLEGWTAPLRFAPGEGWYYGTGPDWAGQVLERVTGQRLGEYMGEHVLRPLGIDERSTGFYVNRLTSKEEGGWDERYVPTAERDGETGLLKELPNPVFPVEPQCESGGAGLYTNAADYGRVMQEVLQVLAGENGIVSTGTVREMFRPQLNDRQREWLRGIVWTFGSAAEIPEGAPVDYGIGGVMNLKDVEGKRRHGSMSWSGMCNSRWWIDPETGIGAAMFVNVIPYMDPTVLRMYEELERAVYAELIPSWQASK
ncbi:hypothetical protein VTI28DRAFT_1241 [Corynascus sepedonium]